MFVRFKTLCVSHIYKLCNIYVIVVSNMTYETKTRKMWRVVTVVPYEWRQLIERRVKEKGYTSVGEYLRDLIRTDLELAKLLEGV